MLEGPTISAIQFLDKTMLSTDRTISVIIIGDLTAGMISMVDLHLPLN